MVGREMYGCVKSSSYLGNTLGGYSVTPRLINLWMKFRELLLFMASRAPPTVMKHPVYASCNISRIIDGSVTRPLLTDA